MNWIRERGNILIILTLVFVGVVLILGGIYIYFHKSPEKIVKTMMTKMQDVKSVHYQINIETSGKAPLSIPFKFPGTEEGQMPSQQSQDIKASLSLEGDIDLHDINNPQISFLFNFRTGPEPLPPDLEGELRMINKAIYLKLSKLPVLLEAFNLSQFTNQWIKIDIEAGQDQFGLKKSEEPSSEVQLLDKLKKLQDLAKEKDIYTVKEVSEDEVINGVKTYHYSFDLNKAEFKDFIIEVYKIVPGQDFQKSSKEQLKQIDQAMNKQMDAFKNIELWIGKKDHLLYKAAISYNYVDQDKGISIASVFSTTFSSFNEPIHVAEPENVKLIKEILENLFKGLKLPF